jgi:hypothetical protein
MFSSSFFDLSAHFARKQDVKYNLIHFQTVPPLLLMLLNSKMASERLGSWGAHHIIRNAF